MDLLVHHAVVSINVTLPKSKPERRLRHPKLILSQGAKSNAIVLVRQRVSEEAQVDDEALVDAGWDLAIAKGIAVDLRVPGVLLCEWGVHIGVKVVEREGQNVVSMVAFVCLDSIFNDVAAFLVEMSWVISDPLHVLLFQDNLAERHVLLCQIFTLQVISFELEGHHWYSSLTRAGKYSVVI